MFVVVAAAVAAAAERTQLRLLVDSVLPHWREAREMPATKVLTGIDLV